MLIRVSWVHQLKTFLNTIVTIINRYCYYVFLSSILEFCSGDYPSFLAIFPAIGLVVTDLIKNTALMQLYLHGNLAFYNIRTALTHLIFDKVSFYKTMMIFWQVKFILKHNTFIEL